MTHDIRSGLRFRMWLSIQNVNDVAPVVFREAVFLQVCVKLYKACVWKAVFIYRHTSANLADLFGLVLATCGQEGVLFITWYEVANTWVRGTCKIGPCMPDKGGKSAVNIGGNDCDTGRQRLREVWCVCVCVCVYVYGDLQRCLSNIPKNDVIIVLGDFNARVGVGTGSADDVWQDVRGRFGVGNCNAAGERLLMWCATNQLSIMNTWFQKPDFRRGTWKHPATKQYHMIDFVLMHRHQRARCHDVAVVRVANCFTDHFMVRARIAFGVTQRRSMRSCNKPCKIAVERLSDPRTCKTFQKDIEDGLFTKCESTATAEGKSNTICDCLQETSDQVLGPWGRVQSDWFLQALPGIQAILDEKNKCHMAMVQKDIRVSRSRFRASQKRVAKTVRQAKEQWIGRLSKAADDSDRDSKWPCIKKLQLLHSGRKPVRIPTIVDEQGNLLSQPDDIRGRWLRHFSDVLNVESKFEPSVLNMVPEQAQRSDLDVPPTMVELLQAMKCLTAGKAAGESGILPEMVINGGRALHLHILSLMTQMRLVWLLLGVMRC